MHMGSDLIHMDISRDYIFFAVSVLEEVVSSLKKMSVFLFGEILWGGNNPTDHDIDILTILTMDLATSLFYKFALRKLLMDGQVIV